MVVGTYYRGCMIAKIFAMLKDLYCGVFAYKEADHEKDCIEREEIKSKQFD